MDFREFGGGGRFPTTFQDSFARGDQPFMVGDLWVVSPLQGAGATAFSPSFASGINVSGNSLNLTVISTNGQNQTMLWPIPINWPKIFLHNQYAQAKLSADNSGGASFGFTGPAVMVNVNKATGYVIWTNGWIGTNLVGVYSVVSLNGGGAATNLNNNAGAGFPFAIGDTLRIEARINTPASGQTTVNSYRNGVLTSSTVDSTNHYGSGAGVPGGVMGISDSFTSTGITQSWQLFDGGGL